APRGVPSPALRPRGPGGLPAGPQARRVLPGLLLGADAADVRGGGRPPLVDGSLGRAHGLREGWAQWGPGGAMGRVRPPWSGRGRLRTVPPVGPTAALALMPP